MSNERNFNRNHPELQQGEVFLANAWGSDFHEIVWLTKRLGSQAYDIYGKPLTSGTPVFVQISEMKAKNVPTAHLEPLPLLRR